MTLLENIGNGQRDLGHANGKMKAAGTSAPKTHDDTESLSGLGEEDIRVEHDRYFGKISTQGESDLPVSLELLTDNETDAI